MPPGLVQLLDPEYEPILQKTLFSEEAVLRYVVKLHDAFRLHYDFRLEVCGRLFSLAVDDAGTGWPGEAAAVRVGDHDPRHLLGERLIPPGQTGEGPVLVWDHGIYRSDAGTQADVYRQLASGCLVVTLEGVRLNGRFRLAAEGRRWLIQRLSGSPPLAGDRSVLTGRSLEEIRCPTPPRRRPFRLWLEWEHYYTDPVPRPQAAVQNGRVCDVNFAAKAAGIAAGMRLQHVLPLVPGCEIREPASDPARQKGWLDQLVGSTDVIQPLSPHCAVVDLSAHPDPAYIAARIIARLTARPCGHLRYGIGPCIWMAQLAALKKDPYGFAADPAASLDLEPVDSLLAATPEERARLSALGFKSIGAIRSVSPSELKIQFGERAQAISFAAWGRTCDQVAALYPPGGVCETLMLPAPVNDSISLQSAVTELAQRLAMAASGRQASLVILAAESEDGAERSLERSCKKPVHTTVQILASLTQLAGEIQQSCPDIVRLTARLDGLEPLKSSQQDLFAAMCRTDRQAVLDALKSSLGGQSIILASEVKAERREQVLKAWRHATGWN